MNLCELFIQSRGQPIQWNGQTIMLMDRIPITSGRVVLEFLGSSAITDRGFAVKSAKGWIELTDGKRVKLLHVWDEPGLPRCVTHLVSCPDGELRVWNIYRTRHWDSSITVDAWTGNSGMILKRVNERTREYACSSGPGEFDATELLVRISWKEME